VLRHEGLTSYLVKLLNDLGNLSNDLRRELLNTFSFIVYKAEQQEVYERLMSE